MKISFIIQTIGIENNLQYWNSVLENVTDEYGEVILYTKTKHYSTQKIKIKELPNAFNIFQLFYKDSLIKNILFKDIDICFTNEFNIWSFIVVFACYFSKTCKSILLVENDPKFLKGYGIDKTSYLNVMWRRIITHFSTVVVTNNYLGKNYLIETLSVDKKKIIESPYLVSSLPHKKIEEKKSNDRVKFLFVGQLIKRKGLQQLVKAVNELSLTFKEKAELHIVGNGDLEDKINLGLSNEVLSNVFFHGFVPYAEMYKYYQLCDVFIWTTLADYRALVGFEALSSGLPVIFSIYDGACDEVVFEPQNGFKVDPYNYIDVANKMKWFIQNKDSIPYMSHFSIERSRLYSLAVSKRTLLNAINSCKYKLLIK